MEVNLLQKRFNDGEIIEFEKPTIVLASASQRRADMLKNKNLSFVQIVSSFDDTNFNMQYPHQGLNKRQAINYAKQMALLKLKPFYEKVKNGAVIAADTTVFCKGKILEKPLTKEKCKEQHEFLSNKTNINLTAYAVYFDGKVLCKVMQTKVKVKNLSAELIEKICQEDGVLDAAGYRNQGNISPYLKFKESERPNLYGLHVPFVLKMLKKIGYKLKK